MPPTIPTSFVPRQPVSTGSNRPARFNLSGAFFMLSLFILGLALAASAAVFAYEKYLQGEATSKAAELAQDEQNVSPNTVQQFVELQNRLSSATGLLDSHVTLSTFFNLLESVTLSHVQYTSLKLAIGSDRSASLDATGIAATFNALAAESKSFSANPGVERAVFSNFSTQKDGSVSFALTATIKADTIASLAAASARTTAPAATPAAPAATVPAVGTTSPAAPTSASTTPKKS